MLWSTIRGKSKLNSQFKFLQNDSIKAKKSSNIIYKIGKFYNTAVSNEKRIITIQSFNPTNSNVREFFNTQLKKLDQTITRNTIVVGDFKIDLKRAEDQNYSKRTLMDDFNNLLGHHNLKQLCNDYTWCRVILTNN